MFKKQPLLPYDPRLKVAMKEIRNILHKHAIGGYVDIVSETHSETMLMFPKWSLIQMENNGDGGQGIRLRQRSAEHERSENSLGCLLRLRDGVSHTAMFLLKSADTLLEKMQAQGAEVKHTPFHNFKPETWEEPGDT